jgi:hypothetical protein
VRALGFVVVSRRPARAVAELRGVLGVLTHPQVVSTGRRDRAGPREVAHRELRHLFPTASRRWHASPFRVGRLGSDRLPQLRSAGGAETGPVSEESESLVVGDSAVGRFLRRPGSVLFIVMSVIAFVAERHVLSSAIHGGRLLPAPGGSADLWSTYVASFHPSSIGSSTPAPPSLAILALASSILLGKVWLLVDLLILGAVPFAALSAFTAARALTSAARVRIWVAVVYSLLPAVTGAIAGGRLDVAVVAILLPQLLRVSIGAIRHDAGNGGWRRSIAAGLLLAVVIAFAPVVGLIAVPAMVVGIGFMDWDSEESATIGRLASAAIMLAVAAVVLMPWSWHVLGHPRMLLNGSGLPEFYAAHSAPSGLSLLMLRAGGPAQPPIWIGIPVLAAGLLGLNRQSRVAVARTGIALLVFGVALAVALTRGAAVTAGVPASRHWPGVALLVAGAGALLSALVAAVGARPALRQQDFGWRQPAAVAVVGLALLSTAWLAVGWVIRGADGPLTADNPQVLPLFTQSELAVPATPRALVLTSTGSEITYALVRRPTGPRLGDADTAPYGTGSVAQQRLATAVRDLVAGRPGAGNELAPLDIQYVVAQSDTARAVASALGRADTLRVVPAPGATVWRSALPTGELTVLAPAAAAQATGGTAVSAAVSQVLPAKAGSADVTVPPGPAGRLVVLAEPADGGWRATIKGSALPRKTAYGWAQAFEVPATGGRLHLEFSHGSRDTWLTAELVVLVVLVGAMLPGRRPDDEADLS